MHKFFMFANIFMITREKRKMFSVEFKKALRDRYGRKFSFEMLAQFYLFFTLSTQAACSVSCIMLN